MYNLTALHYAAHQGDLQMVNVHTRRRAYILVDVRTSPPLKPESHRTRESQNPSPEKFCGHRPRTHRWLVEVPNVRT